MRMTRFALPLAALLGAGALSALEITLPEETARLVESPLPGYTLATTYCFTCHSVDYIATQPPMTREQWKASVTKMQKVFGAVIPENAVDRIAEYLAMTYGTEKPAAPSPADTGGRKARKKR